MGEVFNVSLIADIAALGIIVICTLVYASSGFLSAIVDLVGTLVALVVSFFASRFLSTWIFEMFFRAGIHSDIVTVLETNGVTSIMDGIRAVLSFLPDGIIDLLSRDVPPMLNASADTMAVSIIDQVVIPVIVPIIMFVLFIIFLMVGMFFAKLLSKTLKQTKKIPLVGPVNTILGAVTGAVTGSLFASILGFFMWVAASANGQTVFAGLQFGDSILYKLISSLPWLK